MLAQTKPYVALPLSVLVAALLLPSPGQADEAPRYRYRPLHVALVSPLSYPRCGALRIIGLSLNLVYGRLSGLYGIQAGLVNHEDGDAAGVQVGGLANWVGGDAWGIQLAGGMNRALRRCGGICLAGGINWHSGGGGGIQLAGVVNGSGVTWNGQRFVGFAGLQIGGIANLAAIFYGLQVNLVTNVVNDGFGLQVALVVNAAYSHFAGVQIAVANLNGGGGRTEMMLPEESRRLLIPDKTIGTMASQRESKLFREPLWADPMLMSFRTYLPRKTQGLQVALVNMAYVLQGLQLSFAFNLAVSQLQGVQITPFGANHVAYEASGVQIALAYNKAQTLRGVQVGLVNVCRTLYGVQFGLVNVCRTLHGFQFGVINIAYRNRLPFMIGMNAGF